MIARLRPNVAKALEVLLYVAKRAPNMYNALKVVYFADKQHLVRYGRLIYGDEYVAMSHGPVPSLAYDLIKQVRGDAAFELRVDASEAFSISEDHQITVRRDAELSFLSESDIECLDQAVEQYGCMPFVQLKTISHEDAAFQSAGENDFMTIKDIAESLSDPDLVAHLENG